MSPLLLRPRRVSMTGRPRSLVALPQRTNHESAFFPTSYGGAQTRDRSPSLAPCSSGVVCGSCGGKRLTVPARTERKSPSRFSKFPLNSAAASHLDPAASPSLFGIPARPSFVWKPNKWKRELSFWTFSSLSLPPAPFSSVSPPPAPLSGCCVSLALFRAGPAHRDVRPVGGGGGYVASHAHTP